MAIDSQAPKPRNWCPDTWVLGACNAAKSFSTSDARLYPRASHFGWSGVQVPAGLESIDWIGQCGIVVLGTQRCTIVFGDLRGSSIVCYCPLLEPYRA